MSGGGNSSMYGSQYLENPSKTPSGRKSAPGGARKGRKSGQAAATSGERKEMMARIGQLVCEGLNIEKGEIDGSLQDGMKRVKTMLKFYQAVFRKEGGSSGIILAVQ
jgi:hypothetical protein